jgi:hypothetical protein
VYSYVGSGDLRTRGEARVTFVPALCGRKRR